MDSNPGVREAVSKGQSRYVLYTMFVNHPPIRHQGDQVKKAVTSPLVAESMDVSDSDKRGVRWIVWVKTAPPCPACGGEKRESEAFLAHKRRV